MSARVRVLAAALIHGQPAAAKARRLEWGVRMARGRRGGRLAELREVDVERDGSLQNRVATGKAAQADQSALAGCDRAAGRRHEGGETEATTRLGERIGQFERPAASNSGVSPRRLSSGVAASGDSARSTGRPRPVADRSKPGRCPAVVNRSMKPG